MPPGTATASQLAEHVDETPSLVSYHLRKLAEHGFVTQASGQGADGRERWWQVASEEGWGFRDSDCETIGRPLSGHTAPARNRQRTFSCRALSG